MIHGLARCVVIEVIHDDYVPVTRTVRSTSA
jgi:hypothetical protein